MMTPRNEVVFIDSNLSDYQTLLNDIPVDAQIHIIDGSRDGLQQMLAFLTGRTNIDAIHVLGHGNSGALQLGKLTLNSQNIEQYQTPLQQLGQKLTSNGDLLFYGCNVAQGETGQTFIKQMADFTRADVAASTDLTGSNAQGGDWVLENHTGAIEANALNVSNWQGVLGTPDTTSPVFQSAATSTDGTKVILTYDEALNATTAAASTFAVSVGGSDNIVTGATVNGSTVELTLTTSITTGQAVTVAYTAPASDAANTNNAIQDATGNDAVSLTSTSVSNNVPDTIAPTFDVAPTASNVAATTLDLSASIDEAGTIYYVVVANNAVAPSAAEVVAGTASGGGAALKSGNSAVATTPFTGTFNLTDLTASTDYDVYVVAKDTATNVMAAPTKVDVTTTAPNAVPTLTTISTLTGGTEDTEKEITFANLQTAGDEADSDGTVTGFVAKVVSTGSLKIGADSATATPFATGTNDLIDSTHIAYWTPALNANGTATPLNAFTVMAKDNGGAESATPVQIKVEVAAVNDAPVITSTPITTTAEDSVYSYSLTATDAESEPLTWSVANGETLPAWLSLSAGASATSDFATGITQPGGVASDPDGNTYVISTVSPYQIYKIAPDGTKTNFGQTNINGRSYAMTFDSGNLYVSSFSEGKIFKYTADGTQSVFATVGEEPCGMTVKEGFMYVANWASNKIQKVSLADGTFSDYKTVPQPFGVVFDSNGVMYVADWFNSRIVKFTTTDTAEIATSVVATDAKPSDIKIDANNNLYVSTYGGGLFKYADLGVGTKTHIASPNGIWGMSLNSNGAILMGDASSKIVKLETGAVLTGTPTNADVGSHLIHLSTSDGTNTVTHDFTLTVTNVNDAPTGLGNLTLASVLQNTASPTGAAISALTGLNFVDVDADSSLGGVAIVENTANATTQGAWQYSTNAGANWFDIGTVANDATALALSATTLVRFVPVNNYNGTPPILTVRAVDETYDSEFSTTAGAETRVTVDATANGGTTAISANTNTISTTITPPPPPPEPEPTPTPVPAPTPVPVPTPAPPVVEKPVSRDVEMQVPSASGVKGDGNGDGIADVDQKHVISLPTQKDLRETGDTPKVFLSIELPTGQTLTKAEVKSVAEMTQDKPITFATETIDAKGQTVITETAITEDTAPFGLFEFNFAGVPTTTDTTTGAIKGGTTDVKLYLDDNQTVEKYLKQTVSGTWEPIPFSYVYDEKLGKTVVSISLTDGDKFDLDGKIDGGISDPGTPIITPKLTAAPEPVIVEILPKPTTKVFVGYDRTFSLDSGAAQFFGQGEREFVELGANASNAIIDQNIEQVRFPGVQSDYSFEQKGNSLQVAKGSVMIAQITVQDDANGSLFSFENGTQSAKFAAGVITLESYAVVTDDIPRSIYHTGKVFTVQGETIGIDSELVDVYGSSGFDVIALAANATKITIDQNVEQVNFAGNFVDYRFAPAGNSLDIFVGTTQIVNVNVQDDSDGTKFTFADGEHFAKFTLPTTDMPLSIEITGVATNL